MSSLPLNPSKSFMARNPHLYGKAPVYDNTYELNPISPKKRIRQSSKPLLNKTEQRFYDLLVQRWSFVFKQAFTLRLDPPFARYTPDLAYISDGGGLHFVEVKGLHRFRRAGIAKAALAAKTYPQFRFLLAEWDGKSWKESVLSP